MAQAFDYVIVGAGSSGSVLAERLSADPSVTVLLIEEGPRPDWLSRMPKGFGKLMSHPGFAHFYPTSPSHRLQPKETWIRGKMLGGSSSINGMVWIRGGAEDYDSLGDAGNAGWNWSEMLRSYRAMERHRDLEASDYRGVDGPVDITTNPNRTRLADAFIAAGKETGLDPKEDQNGPALEGVGYAQWNISPEGRRISAAQAFLEPARNRPNLVIQSGTRVDRILVEDGRATGVVGKQDGQLVEFHARSAVILCAGAIVTPKLLQLSGIGDGELLTSLGIPVVRHSPMVGQRMHEHLTLALNFRLKHWQDSDNREYGGIRLLGNVLRYMLAGKGPMARGAAEAIAFVRALPGSNRPDTQIMFNPYSLEGADNDVRFESEPGMQCYSYLLRPESEGYVKITSPDSAVPPKVDANYLGTEQDRVGYVAGTRALRRIMTQPALRHLVVGETAQTASAQSDDEILELYARYGHSGYHAVGTAAMGPDEIDVVDHRLRVRGVNGLLVVDCSVFPQIPSGNTNAPAMALGWRAAEIIREDAEARGVSQLS